MSFNFILYSMILYNQLYSNIKLKKKIKKELVLRWLTNIANKLVLARAGNLGIAIKVCLGFLKKV